MKSTSNSIGDKVRIKRGHLRGLKGVIAAMRENQITIIHGPDGEKIEVPREWVVNFSLAARKAWETNANRAVGRRRQEEDVPPGKVSVTLRFQRELWERFLILEEKGVIVNRTEEVNQWLVKALAAHGG